MIGGEFRVSIPMNEIVAGKQPVHALEKGFIERGILEGEVELQRRRIQLFLEAGVGEEAFALRAEEEQIPHLGIGSVLLWHNSSLKGTRWS